MFSDKHKKESQNCRVESKSREKMAEGAQFATYGPPADWLGCRHAAAAEALDVRSAWPPSHLKHGP